MLPGLSLASVDARRGMGRARARRRRPRRGKPSAISSEAAARPDGRRPRRSRGCGASAGRSAARAIRGRAVANAMTAADFSDKWNGLQARRAAADRNPRRRAARSGGRSPGDRAGAARGGRDARAGRRRWSRPTGCWPRGSRRLLARWGIEADDSAGRPLSQTAAGHLAARRSPRPRPRTWRRSPLLALLKHPLVGGEGEERLALARRGPRARPRAARPAPGGGTCAASTRISREGRDAWQRVRGVGRAARRNAARAAAAERASPSGWRGRRTRSPATRRGAGQDGPHGGRAARRAAGAARGGAALTVAAEDAVPLLRQLLDERRGAAALWRPSAHVHLGPARSAAAAGRSDGARRAQRGRLAGAAGARPVAGAEDPRQPRHAGARVPHRPCRARFRQRARRAAAC